MFIERFQPKSCHSVGRLDERNDIWNKRGQANSTSMQPEQKINKPEELTLLSINFGINITTNHRVHNI